MRRDGTNPDESWDSASSPENLFRGASLSYIHIQSINFSIERHPGVIRPHCNYRRVWCEVGMEVGLL